jgi:hypothetical protein
LSQPQGEGFKERLPGSKKQKTHLMETFEFPMDYRKQSLPLKIEEAIQTKKE